MRKPLCLLPLILFLARSASAFWGDAPKNDTSELLAQLFGKNTGFTATADVSVKGRMGKDKQGAELQYAFLDGKMRVGIDMTKTKQGAKLANEMSVVAGLGMGEIIVLIRPDKHLSYTIVPGVKAYCENPPTLATKADSKPKIERTELGKEDVEGHACTKSKIIITDDSGKQYTVLAWTAADLNDFPVKSEIQSEGDTVVTIFKNVQLTKPAAALFELPAGFSRYDNVQDMMMSSMQRMIGGGRE